MSAEYVVGRYVNFGITQWGVVKGVRIKDEPRELNQGIETVESVGVTESQHLPPVTVRRAGWLSLGEAVIGIGFAIFLLFHQDIPKIWAENPQGVYLILATPVFLVIVFGAIGIGAWRMASGRRWGRGPVVMWNIFLLPLAYYIFSAGQWVWAIPVLLLGVFGLSQLFSKSAVEWATATYQG